MIGNPLEAPILIVDDQESNVLLLLEILKRAGYRNVHFTTDSREAVGLYRSLRPDCVMLDINMPHLDGFQVMDQLKELELDSYLPVMVLTGGVAGEMLAQALLGGAKDYVHKPFSRVEVLTRIRNLLEVRLLHNEVHHQNRVLEARVEERTRDLRKSRLEIVQRLALTAEYRDPDTGNHIARMSAYCEHLARLAGLPAEECDLVLHATPMHDLGKIGIPDRVLLKPGPLTEQEWEVMKSHSQIGANLLAGGESDLMRLAEQVALTHHEKWNGLGYPRKLAGPAIPLVGRIAAICDVFDALTSSRPYKKAWEPEAARLEILKGSETHFDPSLVRLFVAHFGDFLKIREKLSQGSCMIETNASHPLSHREASDSLPGSDGTRVATL